MGNSYKVSIEGKQYYLMLFNKVNRACLFSFDRVLTYIISSSSGLCFSLKNSDRDIPNALQIARNVDIFGSVCLVYRLFIVDCVNSDSIAFA